MHGELKLKSFIESKASGTPCWYVVIWAFQREGLLIESRSFNSLIESNGANAYFFNFTMLRFDINNANMYCCCCCWWFFVAAVVYIVLSSKQLLSRLAHSIS